MKAILGILTCDKCGRSMGMGERVLILAEGDVTPTGDTLTFTGASVRYACHLDCWDGMEDAEEVEEGYD